MKGERKGNAFYKRFWINGRMISLLHIVLLELGRRNRGQLQYWMIDVVRSMGYNGKTSRLFSRMIESGLIDERWRITDEGMELLKRTRMRFGSKIDEIIECVFEGRYNRALEIWKSL